MITQRQVIDLFDYRDGKLFWKKRLSNRVKIGDEVGCKDSHNYVRVGVYGKLYWIHRLIFLYHHGYMPREIDHVNGDVTDNKIENLREASHAQNTYNRGKQSNNTSGFKNVSWSRKHKKWIVRIKVNKTIVHIGVFDTLDFAAKAAHNARNKYHGEFARHA